MSKYLGIDYGLKRVGIAISDEGGGFAFPKGIVSPKELDDTVKNIVSEEKVVGIVIGNSVANSGEGNDILPFIKSVAKRLDAFAPVFLQDEGFSSFEAHRYQTAAGSRDDSAAAIILQRFLDKQKK